MKSIGIIAEYNPFTNGHLYHLNKIKEKYKDYTIILVMNGHFSQRGTPSIINKFKRTEIALKLGIDLVIELPYPFATQSADFFAYGAITILEHLKVVKIVFGSESDDINDLECLNYAKYKITVPNSTEKIKAVGEIQITENFGGNGAFREVADCLTN